VSIEDPEFFGKAPAGSVVQGYVEIRSTGIRLAGSTMFGAQAPGQFSSSLPLVAEMLRAMVIGHVASNDSYFTRLMLVNPGPADSLVTIDLYGADGQLEATVTEQVAAGKLSGKPVTELFPSLAGQNRTSGYLRLTATEPVMGYALIGTKDLSVLTAIPALNLVSGYYFTNFTGSDAGLRLRPLLLGSSSIPSSRSSFFAVSSLPRNRPLDVARRISAGIDFSAALSSR
jgi:hypothetical protein